jgi:beta-lactamase class A
MKIFIRILALAAIASGAVAASGTAGSLRHELLRPELEALTRGFDGRVGACVQDAFGVSCIHGDNRFPMQSVMKLLVAVAAMDAVDHDGRRLDEPVLVRRRDLSLFVQPLAKLVTERGYRTTVGDLVRRAVVDSDSAAADILIGKLGGTKSVQACLERLGVRGLRLDRDERRLQTEIFGLRWRPEYVDPQVLDRAIGQVPPTRRDEAYRAYRADVRDTATPRGMAAMLHALAAGKLLSPGSTRRLMGVMQQTVTSPDRLKAGTAPGWTLGHKTGTSNTWRGLTAATNDVGVLTAPDGGTVSIAVFIADSPAPSGDRAALIARIAAAAIKRYSPAR